MVTAIWNLKNSKIIHFPLIDSALIFLFFSLNVGVRNKPTTGLGRCRAVGLSRPRKNNKDTTNKTNNTLAPLLNYFAYQGRDRPSRETRHNITEMTS